VDDRFTVAIKLCSHCDRKGECGRVLAFLTQDMCCHTTEQAANFICEVIARDFYRELSGSQTDLSTALNIFYEDLGSTVQNSIGGFPLVRCISQLKFSPGNYAKLDKNGEIIDSDSDVDENGNLTYIYAASQ
jgi:hypothetical protein